ncbi:hypothetical protein [Nocardioides antri]|uniref:Uncharacterized protein n=1 Tax=Nocardioides antri TaxID=2607659 RepID=A0A5B1LZW6_9ACTN|nr:hypothetical protein [Nocardioides antri]KAA1426455.1 hypothetical protein F0U47_13710 [Nocardioides antri]
MLSSRLALLLSAVFVLGPLTGCGGEDDSDANSADAPATEAPPSPLADAYDACGPELEEGMAEFGDDAPALDEVIRLEDDGNSIIVTTPEPGGEIASNLAFIAAACVLRETDAPATVTANMQTTTAMSGSQTATWEDIEVVWSYAAGVGNAGFNATFAVVG